MSYTTDIKEEISKNIGSKSEMIAELSGYIRNNGHNTLNGFQLTTENPLICERIEKQLEALYEVKIKKEKLVMSITIGIACFALVTVMMMQFKVVNETDITEIENMRESELRAALAEWKSKTEDITE